jgi:hypothetical protein
LLGWYQGTNSNALFSLTFFPALHTVNRVATSGDQWLGWQRVMDVGPHRAVEFVMALVRLYEHHAEECARAAEQTNDPRRRALLVKLAAEWRAEAQELLQSGTTGNDDRPDAPRSGAKRKAAPIAAGRKRT